MIDASFGLVGFVPMWLCDRWVRQLEGGTSVDAFIAQYEASRKGGSP